MEPFFWFPSYSRNAGVVTHPFWLVSCFGTAESRVSRHEPQVVALNLILQWEACALSARTVFLGGYASKKCCADGGGHRQPKISFTDEFVFRVPCYCYRFCYHFDGNSTYWMAYFSHSSWHPMSAVSATQWLVGCCAAGEDPERRVAAQLAWLRMYPKDRDREHDAVHPSWWLVICSWDKSNVLIVLRFLTLEMCLG